MDSGRIEFAVQQQIDGSWGDRILPTKRFFPTTATVGRWLQSSAVALQITAATGCDAAVPQSTPSERSGCAPLPDHVVEYTRTRLCLPEAGPNTIRLFVPVAARGDREVFCGNPDPDTFCSPMAGPLLSLYRALDLPVGTRLEIFSDNNRAGFDRVWVIRELLGETPMLRGWTAPVHSIRICGTTKYWRAESNPDGEPEYNDTLDSFIFDTLAIPTGNGPHNYHLTIGPGYSGEPNPSGIC